MSRTKLIALLTTILLVTSLLAGCGGTAVKKDAMKEEVTLTFYTMCDASTSKDLELVQNKMNEYLKSKINAKIKFVGIPAADYENKMNTMLSAGEPVDIVYTSFWANPYFKGVSKGFFAPLDELISEYGVALKAAEDPDLFEGIRFGGKIYAVPVNMSYVYQQAYSLIP